MATRVKGDLPKRCGYPWDKWTNGDQWLARPGEDFTCEIRSFQSALHVHARRIGMSVSTVSDGDCVRFQFYDGE